MRKVPWYTELYKSIRYWRKRRWKKQQLNSTFCVNFFAQASTKTTGHFRPCCHYFGFVYDDDKKPFHASTHKMSDYFNSSTLDEIRKQSINNEKIKGCESCYHMEKTAGRSKRIRDNEGYMDLYKKLKKRKFKPEINILDLRMGNDCNLACVSCLPQLSSQLDKLWKKHGSEKFSLDKKVMPESKNGLDLVDWYKNPDFVNEIQSLGDAVNYLAFVGGEPLINKHNFQVLDGLKGRGKKLSLHVTTNLMSLTEEKVKTLENFDTRVNCSLDGIGSTIEYIRYPAQFKTIEKNFRRLLEADVEVRILFTVSVLNIFHLLEAAQWYKSIYDEYNKPFAMTVGNIVTKPDHLAIKNLPQSLKKKAAQELEEHWLKIYKDKSQAIFVSTIYSLIKYLEESEGDTSHIVDGWKYLESYDNIRKNHWQDVAPWMNEVLSEAKL
ncbi:MAG: twitch domain-containing radical SAM protein [Bdellovibrionales bacterium]|nr:twitch domain-containing radical SAM protein [Bdellovibrionales bacterium]NQZ17985.1 twitch domain-containing radical SAM protein [Bdellovibrionales bacterium]